MKTEASEYLSLLQEIQNNNVSTFTVMPADEPRFTIETNSRNIIVPSEFSFLSVQNDHRAETIYFEIDRYFDNVDLSQHACVVQFINKSGTTINEGTYPVTSMDIDSVDGKIVFGWEIRNDATQLTGDITFSVRFYSIDNNGNFTYNFNTLTASSYILPSLNIIASGERITATELEVWTDKMNNLASSIESDIITVEEKIEELENYIASIPEDYTALTEEVSQLSGEIAELNGDLTNTTAFHFNESDFETGAYSLADGIKVDGQGGIRLKDWYRYDETLRIFVPDDILVGILYANEERYFTSYTDYQTNTEIKLNKQNAKFFKLSIVSHQKKDLTVADIKRIKFTKGSFSKIESKEADISNVAYDSCVNLHKFTTIEDLCIIEDWFNLVGGKLYIRNDGGITRRSPFLKIESIEKVITNGLYDVPSISYFSDKNIKSYISSEFPVSPETTYWSRFDRKLNPPTNAKYVVIQWNSDKSITNPDFGVFGKAYLMLENSEYNVAKLKNQYRYLMLSFGYSDEKLSLLGSDDLEHFYMLNKNAYEMTKGETNRLRDPAITQIGDWYYILYSDGFTTSHKIYMCRTKNFVSYEELEPLTYKINGETETYEVWAPCWFTDGFKKYIVWSSQQGITGSYLGEYNPTEHSIGNVIHLNTPEYQTIIDTHIYKENGNYYALVKNESVYSNNLHILKSSAITGEFREVSINLSKFGYAEGQFAIRLDNGKIRIFAQVLGKEKYPMYYADTANFESEISDIKPLEYDENLDDFRLSHATFWDFNKFGSGYGILG